MESGDALFDDTEHILLITTEEVRHILKSVNSRKAEVPDAIQERVLRECANQFTDIFADIFNMSLAKATEPSCFKTATIIPVPKQSRENKCTEHVIATALYTALTHL